MTWLQPSCAPSRSRVEGSACELGWLCQTPSTSSDSRRAASSALRQAMGSKRNASSAGEVLGMGTILVTTCAASVCVPSKRPQASRGAAALICSSHSCRRALGRWRVGITAERDAGGLSERVVASSGWLAALAEALQLVQLNEGLHRGQVIRVELADRILKSRGCLGGEEPQLLRVSRPAQGRR